MAERTVCDDLVAGMALDIAAQVSIYQTFSFDSRTKYSRCEAHAAGILLEVWVVEALGLGKGACPAVAGGSALRRSILVVQFGLIVVVMTAILVIQF